MRAGDLVRVTKKRGGYAIAGHTSYVGLYTAPHQEVQDNGASLSSHSIWVDGREACFTEWHWTFEILNKSDKGENND